MKKTWRILGIVAGLALFLAALSLILSRRDVTLLIDGTPRQLQTRASTVADLLQEEGISIQPGDDLEPAPDASLRDGMSVRIQFAHHYTIWADGEGYRLSSTEDIPADLLDQAGIRVSPHDRILFDGQEVSLDEPLALAGDTVLQVVRAQRIEIHDGEQTETIFSTAVSLGRALWDAGIRLNQADRTSLDLTTSLERPLAVTINRSKPVIIRQGNSSFEVNTTAETVGEVLSQAGFPLQGLDYSIPDENAPIPLDGRISVVRVLETSTIEQDLLPYDTEIQPDPNMPIDTRGISSPGAYGVAASRSRARYENGEEVWSRTEDSWIALEPQPLVMGYGTKIEIQTLETPSGELEYWRAVPMYATSYSPCRIFQDRCDSTTASGATLRHGVAAVTLRNYRSMAYTRVYVPGYGTATILDVGGGIPGRNWIDLGYSDEDYISWHQWVTVYFLTPVPPEGLIPYDLN